MTGFYCDEIKPQIQDSLHLLKDTFGSDLLGVYLYGSALVGGLQKYSDIDLFVVNQRKTTKEEKTRLIEALVQISGIYMKGSKRPIEITLVEHTMIQPWHYPPHFDFQYGEWLRESFERGVIEPWQTYEMPDLALIVTQVLLKSHTIYGFEPKKLLSKVPYKDFMKAMLHDVDNLVKNLEHDTRNVLLTYARIWSTLETNLIRSKPAAADWVIKHLPESYQPVLKRAKLICLGAEKEHWGDIEGHIKPCVDLMIKAINTLVPSVDLSDPKNSIQLCDKECQSSEGVF